jgi:hypothetical protein
MDERKLSLAIWDIKIYTDRLRVGDDLSATQSNGPSNNLYCSIPENINKSEPS